MDVRQQAVELISPLGAHLLEWKQKACQDFDRAFPLDMRPSLSDLTIDNFLYDRTLHHADMATTRLLNLTALNN